MSITISTTLKDADDTYHEVIERKGIGHPDTIADGVAESISIAYSKYCLSHYGVILNHWIDKTLIAGALGEMDFGRGELKTPIKLYVFGKMSKSFSGEVIDLEQIIKKAVKKFMAVAVPIMKVDSQLEIIFAQNDYSKNPRWMNPKSIEDLPNSVAPRANDTSVGIGFWPLSTTENLTLALEAFFYDEQLKPRFKYIGQDIKVMVVRRGKHIDATLCVPFIAKHTPSESFYLAHKDKLLKELTEYGQLKLGDKYELTVTINNADSMSKGDRDKRKGYYMLVLGSALDDGEFGVVGRGNGASGIITCMRATSMEAPYGKNPVYHVGKVYTYLGHKLARMLSEEFDCHVTVALVSKMGHELCAPGSVVIETSKDIDNEKAKRLVDTELAKRNWADEILATEFFVPTPGHKQAVGDSTNVANTTNVQQIHAGRATQQVHKI